MLLFFLDYISSKSETKHLKISHRYLNNKTTKIAAKFVNTSPYGKNVGQIYEGPMVIRNFYRIPIL